MAIEVLFFSELKELTGKDREVIHLENPTLKELLNSLLNTYPLLEPILCEKKNRNLRPNINVAINDKFIQKKDKKFISIKDGDRIAFLLPLSGG